MKKTGFLIYLVSFLEGSAVMATELSSAKLLAPYFGNSLYVWTSVFICTLGGLTAGYYTGGIASRSGNIKRKTMFVLSLSAILLFTLPFVSKLVMESTISLSVQSGSLFSCLAFIFPLLFCFGMVSPLLIRIISEQLKEAGRSAAQIYTVSTLGGVLSTFLAGFYFIPYTGIENSIYLTAGMMISACLLFLVSPGIKRSEI